MLRALASSRLPPLRVILSNSSRSLRFACPTPLVVQHRPRTSWSACRTRSFVMPEPAPQAAAPKSRVCVLGAGNFGSCLADHLGDSDHEVLLWSRSSELVQHFNAHHRNPQYLTDHEFPATIHAIGPELPDAETIKGVDVLLFALPTEALRCVAASVFAPTLEL